MNDDTKFLLGGIALWLLLAVCIVIGNETWLAAFMGLGVLVGATALVVGYAG